MLCWFPTDQSPGCVSLRSPSGWPSSLPDDASAAMSAGNSKLDRPKLANSGKCDCPIYLICGAKRCTPRRNADQFESLVWDRLRWPGGSHRSGAAARTLKREIRFARQSAPRRRARS
jgi:hypothetical protein